MRRIGVVAVLALAAPASAQSINVSFGDTGTAPPATYAAAGAAGSWNRISGAAGQDFDHLVALDGTTTNISMTQSPTTTFITSGDPVVTGDDAALLNSGLQTTGAETCLMFSGFAAGTYEVLIYAWTPNAPSVLSKTRQDEAPSTIDVGGAWTGAHAEGVTYARYVVTVGSDGQLPAHSGLETGQPSAALNGVQIRPLAEGGHDAGTTGGGGGGGADNADGGTSLQAHHGGGCAAGGGTGGLVLVLAFAVLPRRRRRERRLP